MSNLRSFFFYRSGLSRQECIDEHKSLFGNKAPSYGTVENWFIELNYGRRSLKDEVREGEVRELIMQDRHVIYREKGHPWEFLPPAYVQYCMNTLPKKLFVLVGSSAI